jgi:hypothetical protein
VIRQVIIEVDLPPSVSEAEFRGVFQGKWFTGHPDDPLIVTNIVFVEEAANPPPQAVMLPGSSMPISRGLRPSPDNPFRATWPLHHSRPGGRFTTNE